LRPLAGLKRQRDFQRLLRQGNRYRGRFLTLVALPAQSAGPLRAAPITSKKVGGAVVRNRLRRRFREILRQSAWRDDAAGDLAVIAHREAATASYAELEQELRRALERARLVTEAA